MSAVRTVYKSVCVWSSHTKERKERRREREREMEGERRRVSGFDDGFASPLLRELAKRHEKSAAPSSVVFVSVARSLDAALQSATTPDEHRETGGRNHNAAAAAAAAAAATTTAIAVVHVAATGVIAQQQKQHQHKQETTIQGHTNTNEQLVHAALLSILGAAMQRVDWASHSRAVSHAALGAVHRALTAATTSMDVHNTDTGLAARALAQVASSLIDAYEKCVHAGFSARKEDADAGERAEKAAALLMELCINPRHKVRRAAAQAAAEIRHATPARHAASALVRACVMETLQKHATSAALRGHNGAKRAEAALAESVLVLLHALSALKGFALLDALAPSAAHLYNLRHPLVSRHLTDALIQSFDDAEAQDAGVLRMNRNHSVDDDEDDLPDDLLVHNDAEALSRLLKIVIPSNTTSSSSSSSSSSHSSAGVAENVDTALARLRCAEKAFARIATIDTSTRLRDAALRTSIAHIVPLVGSDSDGGSNTGEGSASLSFGAAASVQNMLAMARIHSISDECMRAISASLASMLSLRYRNAWHLALPVISSLFEACGRAGRSGVGDEHLASLITQVETLRADDKMRAHVDTALGIAVRWLGADFVLETLPLNLEESVASGSAGRAWLLPIVRKRTRAASLEYWATIMLPLAKRLLKLRADATGVRAQLALAAEVQAWSTLPAFCSWARDTADVFPQIAKELGVAVAERPELRSIVCQALAILLKQNLRARKADGDSTYADFADNLSDNEEDDDSDDEDEEEEEDEVPTFMNADMATENIDILAGFARNFLPIFFNAVVATPPGKSQDLTRAIALYSSVCDPKLVHGFFRTIVKKLVAFGNDESQEDSAQASDVVVQQRCVHLDLVLALVASLNDDDAHLAFATAKSIILAGAKAPVAVLKRGYRLAVRLLDKHASMTEAANLDTVVEMLIASQNSCGTAARRYRLLLIRRVLLAVLRTRSQQQQHVPQGKNKKEEDAEIWAHFIGEAVLGVKEHNAKTRRLAFDHIIILGRAFEAEGRFHEIFNAVLASLAGATPHMISAGVMAIARLLYEFTHVVPDLPQLVETVMQLMRSKAREVIRSVLGFAKVVAVRVPVEEIVPLMDTLVSGLLLWCEDTKNKFKLKVRVILERLVKRCGMDCVAQHIPEEHAKLTAHIRKMLGRADRKKRSGTEEDEEGDDDADAPYARTIAGKTASRAATARRSTWNSEWFSDDDDDEHDDDGGPRTVRTAGRGTKALSSARTIRGRARDGGRISLPSDVNASSDPLNLLGGSSATKHVLNAQKAVLDSRRAARAEEEAATAFGRDSDGKLIITNRDVSDKASRLDSRKRSRGGADADDMNDDTRSRHTTVSKRSTKSRGSPSSVGGRSKKSTSKFVSKVHSSAKYKNKNGTGGDRKLPGAPDPYSFWALDRKLLNRRAQKRKGAKDALVEAAASGKKKKRKM